MEFSPDDTTEQFSGMISERSGKLSKNSMKCYVKCRKALLLTCLENKHTFHFMQKERVLWSTPQCNTKPGSIVS